MPSFSRLFFYRGLVYVPLLFVLGTISSHIVLEGARFQASDLFMLASIVTLAQLASLFLPLKAHSVLALFFCDAVLVTVLVRVSGTSSSPFLVLFPVLAALGPLTFRSHLSFVLIGICLFFSALAIGWGVSILGNWVAILAVGLLSFYLVKLLMKSEVSLEISESARRRLENLQKVILANIPSGLVSIDSDGSVIQINTVGEKILGVREEEFLRRPLRDLIPGLDIDPSDSIVGARTREVMDYLSPKNSILKLGYSTAKLEDPDDNHILGTLLVFQDLTAVIKMEHELRMSEKLAAVGKLAAGIAHEIRNPLAGISGSAQLLMGATSMNEEDSQLLRIIQRESTRLDGLITEFLEYVRPQDMELKAINIAGIAKEVSESVKVNSKWVEMGTQLELIVDDDEILADGDANKMIQVLMNLIINAGQSGAQNVQVQVSKDAWIEVRDNGSGIPIENQSRLFEPFFTTKEKGTGLGLAISYRVIEAMGGTVDVISPASEFCENGGSIFKVRFRKSS